MRTDNYPQHQVHLP